MFAEIILRHLIVLKNGKIMMLENICQQIKFGQRWGNCLSQLVVVFPQSYIISQEILKHPPNSLANIMAFPPTALAQ